MCNAYSKPASLTSQEVRVLSLSFDKCHKQDAPLNGSVCSFWSSFLCVFYFISILIKANVLSDDFVYAVDIKN